MTAQPYKYIDLTYLEVFSNSDETFMKEIISISIEQTDSETDNLKNALAEKDYHKIRPIAHKLKSSMGFMGISAGLIEELRQLESLSVENTSVLKEKTERIINICSDINKELRDKQHQLNAPKKSS